VNEQNARKQKGVTFTDAHFLSEKGSVHHRSLDYIASLIEIDKLSLAPETKIQAFEEAIEELCRDGHVDIQC